MLKWTLSVIVTVVAMAGYPGFLWSQDLPCAAPAAGEPARKWVFDGKEALIREATGKDHDKDWARQCQAWDNFVNEMWARHRPSLSAPTDGWRQKHDDSYYRTAIETAQ